MLKIGKKTQQISQRSKLGEASIKRALDVDEQVCRTCSPTEQCGPQDSLPAPMPNMLAYQIEAERKRALGIAYTRRTTFI